MKKQFYLAMVGIALLVSCRGPAGASPVDPNQKTTIVFDNTLGICAVTVYSSYIRGEETKIDQIPAGGLSEEIEWLPGSSMTFFFSYQVRFKGISDFTIEYIPQIGKDQKTVRVDPNIKTTIVIPPLAETITSPDTLLSRDSYLFIQNNSSYSLQLLRGTIIIRPDNIPETVVNSGERAQYTVNPGAASNYDLIVGADYRSFPRSLVSFEAGCVYHFVVEDSVSLVSEVELKLENVAAPSQNVSGPAVPGTPVVSAGDGFLTLHWTAVEGAAKYEVYLSETRRPPDLPERTVWSPTTVLTGLANKTAYYVWIKAVNGNGSSDFSPRARGIPWPVNEVPAVPGRPEIIPGINQLTVSWEESGGASSYEVYINTANAAPTTPETTSDKTSAVIGNLQNEVIYYIWVCAVNSAGKSDYSPVEAGTPLIPTVAPASPGRPVLTPGSRELIVSWQAVALTESYEVWYGTSGDSAQSQKFGGDIAGTETVITGLTNETTYYVWIRAKNIIGTSGFSPTASAKPSAFAVLPETPDMPTVGVGSRELTVNWQAAEGALFYEVWTGAADNSAYAEKHGADVSGTSVTLTNLVNGTTYYVWVRAKNNIGAGDFSPMASGTPSASAATPPAPQSAPTVTAGSGQLTLSWQAVEGAASYEIWAGTTAGNPTTAAKRGDDISGLSTVLTGLINGTTYYVWIKAKNAVGTSDFSPMASGTPSVFTVSPQAPAAPSVSIGNGQISVSWTAAEGATAYEIWLGTENNSATAVKNGADEGALLSRTISGLTNGTMYYVWIKAKNNVGASGFSSGVSGKPIANAATPTLTSGNGLLSVSWTAIAGADQYEVFYGTGVNPPQTASRTINATSTTITGLVNGTSYNVWVRGKNSTGSGAMSGPASAKPIGNMVTFDINGGTGTIPAAQTVSAGDSVTLPDGSGFSRTGCIFVGWNTNASGTGTNYNAGASYTVTDTIILYARWIEVVVSATGVELVRVPGGSFEMGAASSDYDWERPVHTVTLSGFYMGKYEVTQGQWQAVMGGNPSSGYGVGSNYPVYYGVSWYDALVFCNRLSMAEGLTPAYRINNSTDPTAWGSVPTSSNSTWDAVTIDSNANGYRLPTEAQWEYAAKGGNGSPGNYTYAGSDDPDDVAWYDGNNGSSGSATYGAKAVGTKQPNGLGLYDMSGNVIEWCWDGFGTYSSGAQTDPVGASSGYRVFRGGGWSDSAGYVRSAYRRYNTPSIRSNILGLRVVRP